MPGHDASSNVYLAVNVIENGALSFTPETTPGVFVWKLLTPQGWTPVEVAFPDAFIHGRPFSELVQAGTLKAAGHRYNVTESRFPGVLVNTFTPGTGIAALPFFALVALVTGDVTALGGIPWHTSKIVASLFVAGSASFIFATALAFLRPRRALVVALAYALGTSVFSLCSQALWSHGPTELFLAAGTYFWLLKPSPHGRALAGLCYACAAVCRPTSALLLVVCGAWLLALDRRTLFMFVLGAVAPILLLLAYNVHYFGTPLAASEIPASTSFAARETGSPVLWHPTLWGTIGLLFSPSRGLFVFSPFVAFDIWGIAVVFTRARTGTAASTKYALFQPIAIAVGFLFVVTACWFNWWSGWSYGYRLFVDAMPLLAIFSIPILDRVLDGGARLVFAGLVAWSILVQALGSFAYDLEWNARPNGYDATMPDGSRKHVPTYTEARALAGEGAYVVPRSMDVDRAEYRSRLWSLEDSEIVYYATHFFEAREKKHALMRTLTQKVAE